MKLSILNNARFSLPLAAAIAAQLTSQSASAQAPTTNRYWDPASSGSFGSVDGSITWASPLNLIWTNSNTGGSTRLPNYSTTLDDICNFGGATATESLGVSTTAPATPTIPVSTVNAGSLSFNTLGGNLTLSGGTITLNATSTITTTSSTQTHTITSVLAGAGTSLTKAGAGVLTLSGANTYAGATIISAGRLNLNNLAALGSTTSLTIGGASAATLSSSLTGITITAPITTANTGVSSTIAFGQAANATGNISLNGAIGGNGNMVYTTVGTSNNNLQTINLGAAGTYAGSTTLTSGVTANSNTVRNSSGAANALPTTTVLRFTSIAGTGSGRNTTYDLNGQDQTLAGLSYTGAVPDLRNFSVTSTGAATLTINNTANHSFGGATTAPSTISPPTVTTNARITGAISLTKDGSGTLSLGGTLTTGATVNNHSYTGATNILGGTLRLFSGGAISASTGITVNGSTAKLLQESATAIAPTVTLTQGTLTGSGTVNSVNVGHNTGGIISNNDGVAGASLTIGVLNFNGAATVNTFSSSAAAPIVTTSLASNVAGTVTINPSPSAGTWAAGTYDLISYVGGSIGGDGFAQFALGTVTGASTRQSIALGNSGTAITLTVGADNPPYWVGDGDDKWNLASIDNWKLTTGDGPTTFLAADNVIFNDSATGTGPILVDIDTANVSPNSTTFDNTKDYIINSSGTFGIASGKLSKSGAGKVTLNTVNTFTGSTTINAGSLTIGGAGQLGGGNYAGAITNDGSFIYNSSAAQTLAGIVSGAGSITQNGSGTLNLSGANTFTGGIKITGSTLILSNSTAAGTGTMNIETGGATNANIHFSGALTVANPITVSSGSTGTNTLANVGTGGVFLNGAIVINSGTTLTVDSSSSNNSGLELGAGIISGDGSLVAMGTSTGGIAFRGANTYTGGTTLGGAGLFIPAVSSTGTGASTTDGAFGTGTLTVGDISVRSTVNADTTVGNTLVLGGNITAVNGGASEKTLTFSGPTTLTGSRTITSGVTLAGKSLAFSGVIGDGGNNYGITKAGSGVLLLSGANTYTGATIVNAGTLSITDNAALGTTAGTTTINGGNGAGAVLLDLSAATVGLTIAEPLNFLGNTAGRSRLNNSSAQNHTLTGNIDVSSDTNLAQFWSDGTGSITVSGDVTGTLTNGAVLFLRGTSTSDNNRLTGSVNLVGTLAKTDGGTWTVGAPGKTYTWTDTLVAVGRLKMSLANVLPSSTNLILGNSTGGSTGTLDLNGFNQTVGGITYNGQGVATGTRTITSVAPATLTVNNATDFIATGTNVSTNNVVVTGALSLVKQGAGKLALNGVNTNSGDTTVSEGILSLTKAAGAADANTGNNASTVNISATGATLDLAFTGTDIVDKLFIGGVQQPAGVYGPTATPLAQITNSSGNGTLTVTTGPSANNYASWANDPTKGNIAGELPTGDFDNDGISNVIEYALGMNPRVSSQPAGALSGNVITYTKGADAIANGDVSWTIETSETLVGSWSPQVTQPAGDPALTISYTFTPGTPVKNFARLRVTQTTP